jgi:hypothetical protein
MFLLTNDLKCSAAKLINRYYRLLALKIANGYEDAKSSHLFRDFIDATGNIRISKKQISIELQKRAHNPLLIAAGLNNIETRIPWLDNKKLRIVLG